MMRFSNDMRNGGMNDVDIWYPFSRKRWRNLIYWRYKLGIWY